MLKLMPMLKLIEVHIYSEPIGNGANAKGC